MSTITETTDAAQDTSTIYTMNAGDEFYGTMSGGESDWIAVTLEAGHTYQIGAVGIGAVRTGVRDADITLHAADGSVIPGASSQDDGPGTTPLVSYTATTSGTYYIEVDSMLGKNGQPGPANAQYGLAVTDGDKLSLGVEMSAAMLYRDGGSWAKTPGTAITVTYSFRSSGPATDALGLPAPFYRTTAVQQAAVTSALHNYSDVANITFQQVNPGGYSNDATIRIGDYKSNIDGAGAYASYPGSTASNSQDGDLWLNTTSVSRTSLPYGSYSYMAIIHELGHAMGLAHPGDYNAAPGVSITYTANAQFAQDSNQYSVMSYFDATDTDPTAPAIFPETLMMADIYAIQQLYGINWTTNAGNSVYGFNSNVGGAFDFSVNSTVLACIWDGGGIDTIDVSRFTTNQLINLQDGSFSSVGGYTANLSIAVGCDIENAVGGTKNDVMLGNELANNLAGKNGNDVLNGFAGNDVLSGGKGVDTFVFEAGTGSDTVSDFNAANEVLDFSAALWGNVAKTAQEVVNEFASLVGGHVVFDFGTDEVSLLKVTSLAGLAADIVFH